jgi:hypothetical protein
VALWRNWQNAPVLGIGGEIRVGSSPSRATKYYGKKG